MDADIDTPSTEDQLVGGGLKEDLNLGPGELRSQMG